MEKPKRKNSIPSWKYQAIATILTIIFLAYFAYIGVAMIEISSSCYSGGKWLIARYMGRSLPFIGIILALTISWAIARQPWGKSYWLITIFTLCTTFTILFIIFYVAGELVGWGYCL